MAIDPDPTMAAACLIVIKQVNSRFLDDITHFIQHSQSIFRYLYGKKSNHMVNDGKNTLFLIESYFDIPILVPELKATFFDWAPLFFYQWWFQLSKSTRWSWWSNHLRNGFFPGGTPSCHPFYFWIFHEMNHPAISGSLQITIFGQHLLWRSPGDSRHLSNKARRVGGADFDRPTRRIYPIKSG